MLGYSNFTPTAYCFIHQCIPTFCTYIYIADRTFICCFTIRMISTFHFDLIIHQARAKLNNYTSVFLFTSGQPKCYYFYLQNRNVKVIWLGRWSGLEVGLGRFIRSVRLEDSLEFWMSIAQCKTGKYCSIA